MQINLTLTLKPPHSKNHYGTSSTQPHGSLDGAGKISTSIMMRWPADKQETRRSRVTDWARRMLLFDFRRGQKNCT